VIKIESLSGELIAVYMNYSMHAVTSFMSGEISGEFSGEAERYIEHRFGDKPVAILSSGAAGDQSPLYAGNTGQIANLKFNAIIEAHHMAPNDIGAVLLMACLTAMRRQQYASPSDDS